MGAYKIKLEKFEGPLDLLLQLIEANEMPITEVSLASVTEQYVFHIKNISDKNPEELADFLLIASKLLLIKSRTLIPSMDLGMEEDGISLEDQLKLYKEYAEASKMVHGIIIKHAFTYPRERAPLQKGIFMPPQGTVPKKLEEVFKNVLLMLAPIANLPKIAMQRVVSIKEKIEELRNIILSKAEVSFKSLIRGAKNKIEVIVSFLALLELIKQKIISVNQENLFEDIQIAKSK